MALVGGCAGRFEHVVERGLAAPDGLACPGYLVWNNAPVRDVFLVINGSGTGSNAFVHPSFAELLTGRPVAYSTYDKPGVSAPFGDPGAVRRDYATLERYTLGHGIACAREALLWAREQFGPSVRLHLRGHSEGALVALYLYDALLDGDPETASKIATLVLSGLALHPIAALLENQLASLPDGARLRTALASCDWAVLKQRLGVSCAYLEDAARRPSGVDMFKRLAARAPGAQLHVFQGTRDWNTPVEPVRALEQWNASSGHLRIAFHYYEGGHAGTEAAKAELSQLLAAIVSTGARRQRGRAVARAISRPAARTDDR
jgi:pimeloyl-ACP methyl ester carboxylesterase